MPHNEKYRRKWSFFLDTKATGKGLVIFLVLAMTIAVNVGDNAIARLGFDQDYLKVALCALVLTGLVMHQKLMLIGLVLFLSVGANMPADFLLNFGLDRDLFVGALGAVILLPVLVKVMDF
jgi:hypothetical protein